MGNIVKSFVWKTAKHNGNEFIPVTKMPTKHLFYTWLMIWNHAAPNELRIWFKNKYKFGSFYTKEYMIEAFRSMYIELKRRDDIGPKMLAVIEQIENSYKDTVYSVSEIKKIPTEL